MKLQAIFVIGLALCVFACTREEPITPPVDDEAKATAPVSSPPPIRKKAWQSDVFLAHMHRHAQQLDKLNLALAEGDFDAAMTPAYWLSRHEQVTGLPDEWQPYLSGVRSAARDVEASADAEAARAAAERITVECQGCHTASDVEPGV
jgi:hypothetical protein